MIVTQISVIGHAKHITNNLINNYQIKLLEDKYGEIEIRWIDKPSQISSDDLMCICLRYYKLIKPKYFNRPKHGTFVIHASDLPKGRGWAPVNWAIINGESEIISTSFKIDEGCDTGPYHLKTRIPLLPTDTIVTAYEKVEKDFLTHLISLITEALTQNKITLYPQEGQPTIYPRRTADDSELDINKTIAEQWNLLRACHNQDYPAFFKIHNKKIIITYEIQ